MLIATFLMIHVGVKTANTTPVPAPSKKIRSNIYSKRAINASRSGPHSTSGIKNMAALPESGKRICDNCKTPIFIEEYFEGGYKIRRQCLCNIWWYDSYGHITGPHKTFLKRMTQQNIWEENQLPPRCEELPPECEELPPECIAGRADEFFNMKSYDEETR